MEIADKSFDGIRLPRLLSDGMVLQRDADIRIWGWAAAGGNVTVSFSGKSYSTLADSNGKWFVTLPPMEAGGLYHMEITAGNSIAINNILIGDVWVCSGQSNMTIPMSRVEDLYADDISKCENTAIRLFTVPDRYDFKIPQQDLQSGSWVSPNPVSILDFTAVGYFFAKALFEKYQVPIGLINASVGGSPVEAWMSGLGEWNDVHPLNKKDIGIRLSLIARQMAYGDNHVICSGPVYHSMKFEENKIIIEFLNTGGGLVAGGNGVLKHFAVAGSDRSFVWAEAKIKGLQVEVWSSRVPNPAAVRYAWADNPEGANLYNKEGLPASPFRTDDW